MVWPVTGCQRRGACLCAPKSRPPESAPRTGRSKTKTKLDTAKQPLIDYTGRLFREGKARISAELAGILDRIGSSAASWHVRMERLKNGRSFGRFFAASRDKLRELAKRLKVRHLVNLVGCAAPS
jgi:hypothetical protein